METTSSSVDPIDEEWCRGHFDYASPQFAAALHPTFAKMRAACPVTRSDQYGGHWVVTSYEDVLRVAQDWDAFSSQLGIGIPENDGTALSIPEHIDPPLHRVYKRLINAHFTPAAVSRYEQPTRALASRLIDEFVGSGSCDFMAAFARPFPGLAFFELVLNAPSDEVAELNDLASGAVIPANPDVASCYAGLTKWIDNFVALRRRQARRDDVVQAIMDADIDGRPITHEEVQAIILLLILGGLETTAGALGQIMIRFCQDPALPAMLRSQPELIPDAVEELLRLENPFVFVGRTARYDAEIAGQRVRAGEKVLIAWGSANRDAAEFEDPDEFRLDRKSNRHVAFGAGPHRCAGSNLARMNLGVALGELVQRLRDIQLGVPVQDIAFHSYYNRAPLSVPITFTPGPDS